MSNLERFREKAMKELEELTSKGTADVNTTQAIVVYTKAIKGIDSIMDNGYSNSGYSRRGGYDQVSRDGYSNYGNSNREDWGNSRDNNSFKHRLEALLEEMDRK